MDPYKINDFSSILSGNTYPGRGIVIGKTPDGTKSCAAYFIMGRSENSRNRVITEKGGIVRTEPFDSTKVEDPSLIIYNAMRKWRNNLIVTNGDQTDTLFNCLSNGKTFEKALETRDFEPDSPNLTPRISGMITFEDGDFSYKLNIIKSVDEQGTASVRYNYCYPSVRGLGHFIHTYISDGEPLPPFTGEPKRVVIDDSIDTFTEKLWNALDKDNRISLYVRYTDLATGKEENRLLNKNGDAK